MLNFGDKTKFEIISTVSEYVKKEMMNEASGHDWWHIYRVYNLANMINEIEQKDDFIVKMIALLHDIYDDKISEKNPMEAIPELLQRLDVYDKISSSDLNNILHSITNLGFKGGFNNTILSPEGQIVQDADRIDAIGAIGIARVFAYGGKKGRPIFDPERGIFEVNSEEEYRSNKKHSINHFYEKLLKLKDTMNTKTGKKIAEERTEFMEHFLDQFYKEWYGSEKYEVKGLSKKGDNQMDQR